MSNDTLTRLMGGSPGRVLVRLVLMSFLVGLLLSALNIHPIEIFDWFATLFERIYNMGFRAVEHLAGYFLLGAVIVIPIWLIVRLLNMGKSSS